MLSSCTCEPEKLHQNETREWRNSLHAYAWGCYSHICFHRFLRACMLRRGISVPRFQLCNVQYWDCEYTNNVLYETLFTEDLIFITILV